MERFLAFPVSSVFSDRRRYPLERARLFIPRPCVIVCRHSVRIELDPRFVPHVGTGLDRVTGMAQRAEVVVIVCATIGQRYDMVHLCRCRGPFCRIAINA